MPQLPTALSLAPWEPSEEEGLPKLAAAAHCVFHTQDGNLGPPCLLRMETVSWGDQYKNPEGNILADLTIQAEPLGTMSPNPDPPGEGWAVFVGGSAHDTSARPGSPLVNAVGTVRWKRGGWASQPLQPQRHVRRGRMPAIPNTSGREVNANASKITSWPNHVASRMQLGPHQPGQKAVWVLQGVGWGGREREKG